MMIYRELVSLPNFLPPAGLITFTKVANFIKKRYLTGQMYNVQPFWGEEFLDSGHLGRGKIQEMLQEYIPLETGDHKKHQVLT